jgi:hypothetical protein
MERARRVSLTAAIFVLVCFFLPWVQVSCGGVKETASGFDLARDGDSALWLVPLLMLAVVLLGLVRVWKQSVSSFTMVSLVSGLVSAYLMNRERVHASNIIGAHVTGWFWLGLFLSLAVAISGLTFYLKRSRST